MRANRVCPSVSALGELLFKPDETGTRRVVGPQVDGSSPRLTANSCWLNQMFGCAGGNVGWGEQEGAEKRRV